MQELLDKTRDYAVYKLSPDAVLDYYKVQDATRRKASAFTNLTGYVMLDNPSLNAAQDYPITNPGNAEKQRERQESKNKVLQKIAMNTLCYFYRTQLWILRTTITDSRKFPA